MVDFIEINMNRGEYYRYLRKLELQDEEERIQNNFEYLLDNEIIPKDNLVSNIEVVKDAASDGTVDTITSLSSSIMDDKVDILPESKLNVLRYDSYLLHQRYTDDYKHSNCHYVDYTVLENKRLIVEQQRGLGKGGLIWDAAVVLADYLIGNKALCNNNTVVELGAGTGLAGMAIAKAKKVQVTITDLQELLPLMQRNIKRNFHSSSIITRTHNFNNDRGEAANDIPRYIDTGSRELSTVDICTLFDSNDISSLKESVGSIGATVLRWGVKEDYKDAPYDVVIGGDVVASLYCPKALAQTIYDLCHENSHVYLSLNRRLDDVILRFEEALKALFWVVEEVEGYRRIRNAQVFLLHVCRKR